MKTLNRCGALAIVICGAGGNALADPPKDSDDPSESCPSENAPATCPQQTPPPAPMAQPAPEVSMAAPPVEEPSWIERAGFAIAAGGGVDDFAGSAMRAVTSVGGNWTVRATLGSKQYLAIEGAYIGSAQNINVLGLNSNATLVGNGAQADLRLNLTSGGFVVQPFIYGGAAWRHYSLSNVSFNTSDINNNDDVFEVPAGLGLAGHFEGFIADVRGEYRFSFGDDLISGNSMARWGVTGTLGYEF